MVYPLRCEKRRGYFAFTAESTWARLALNSWQRALATLLQFMQSLDNNIKCQVLNTRADDQTLALIYAVPSTTSLTTQKMSRFKIAVPKEEIQICKPKSLLTFFLFIFLSQKNCKSEKIMIVHISPPHNYYNCAFLICCIRYTRSSAKQN